MEKTSKIFRTSLALTLVVFAFTMSSPSSLFQIIQPAEAAGTLTDVKIIPTSNIVNERATYDIFFKTATTGTIKIIHMTFPSGFDVSAATRVIEKSGIGSGSLSPSGLTTLIYTVTNPVSVSAGTAIRLEIGRIVNSNTAGSFKIGIATENETPIIIDGPTQSSSFPIKDITGNDVSKSLMKQITLFDDATGNLHGWDPNGNIKQFSIHDISDVTVQSGITLHQSFQTGNRCGIGTQTFGFFDMICDAAMPEGTALYITVINPPVTSCCSAASVTTSSTNENNFSPPNAPTASSSQYESLRALDQIASEFP